MKKRTLIQALGLAALATASGMSLAQQQPFKIGLILPMTGQQATTGRQIEAATRLWISIHPAPGGSAPPNHWTTLDALVALG